jgi:hypothetical protein
MSKSLPFYHRIPWHAGGASHVFSFLGLTVCFGWLGNCGSKPLLRFDNHRLKGRLPGFEVIWDSGRFETRILLHEWCKPWTWRWNSEWVAYRLGVFHDSDDDGRGPDYWDYDGILGYHMYV